MLELVEDLKGRFNAINNTHASSLHPPTCEAWCVLIIRTHHYVIVVEVTGSR